MVRDEFEAVVWQQLGAYATNAIVDRILFAADSYAITEGGITAERRAELGTVLDRKWSADIVRPCGTDAAYRRHVRHGEKPCPQCVTAHNAARQETRQRAAQRQTPSA